MIDLDHLTTVVHELHVLATQARKSLKLR